MAEPSTQQITSTSPCTVRKKRPLESDMVHGGWANGEKRLKALPGQGYSGLREHQSLEFGCIEELELPELDDCESDASTDCGSDTDEDSEQPGTAPESIIYDYETSLNAILPTSRTTNVPQLVLLVRTPDGGTIQTGILKNLHQNHHSTLLSLLSLSDKPAIRKQAELRAQLGCAWEVRVSAVGRPIVEQWLKHGVVDGDNTLLFNRSVWIMGDDEERWIQFVDKMRGLCKKAARTGTASQADAYVEGSNHGGPLMPIYPSRRAKRPFIPLL
ncbi:hypothetical protein BDZ91DRAFT_766813 [Kalaharituber pfeilii]|nr:hypothetical protein BDZ91DRAFT_766813 [Kalaharituber pfeilii]